jgi:hypothetical protein
MAELYSLLTPYVWWKYNVLFKSFWFMPTISGMQLGCKKRVGLYEAIDKVNIFYLCYNVKDYNKI